MRLGEKREWLKELEQGTEAEKMRRTMEYLGMLDRETGLDSMIIISIKYWSS